METDFGVKQPAGAPPGAIPLARRGKKGAIEEEPQRQRLKRPAADAEKARWLRSTLPAEASGVNCIPFLVEFEDHFKL
jgi:hypothetical protein